MVMQSLEGIVIEFLSVWLQGLKMMFPSLDGIFVIESYQGKNLTS